MAFTVRRMVNSKARKAAGAICDMECSCSCSFSKSSRGVETVISSMLQTTFQGNWDACNLMNADLDEKDKVALLALSLRETEYTLKIYFFKLLICNHSK